MMLIQTSRPLSLEQPIRFPASRIPGVTDLLGKVGGVPAHILPIVSAIIVSM